MQKIRKYKNVVERFLSGEGGQRFFNIAYSLGAAVVILGALFKILHLSGGDVLLSVGMGTEVLMFIITAFDRPPKDYRWEEVFPELEKGDGEVPREAGRSYAAAVPVKNENVASVMAQPDVTVVNGAYVEQMTAISEQLARLRGITQNLNSVSETLLQSCQSIADNTASVTAGSKEYAEQMGELNRDLKDVRYMYERSALQGARYCEESEKMTRQMQELNRVYENMLRAMGSGNS